MTSTEVVASISRKEIVAMMMFRRQQQNFRPHVPHTVPPTPMQKWAAMATITG